MSRSIANAVDAELHTVVVVLNTLSTATTLEDDDFEGFGRRLRPVLRQQPGWYGIILARPDGTMLVDTRAADASGAAPLDAADTARLTAGPEIGQLVRDQQNRWYFPVRVPVLRDGQMQYVLSALVSATVIRDAIVRQRVPPDWVISIVDQNNRRVARSRAHDENIGGQLSPSALAVMAAGGAEGFGVSSTLEGERIYTPYSRLRSGWAAVLGLPTGPADAAMRQAIAVYAGGVLLSIALGLLGAAWVGHTITRPIAELREAAVAVGSRQAPEIPDTSICEVRELGFALQAAAEELRGSDTERDAALARERAAREVAEAADRSKDEFLGVLSHELRTPLNAVYGWARMLQAGQIRDEATAARARDAIVRNAGIQMQMIEDLLDLSRIASGKMRLELQPVDLVTVIDAAIEAVRPAAAAKQIAIVTDIAVAVPRIAGDAGRLQQVFWNLLMNAVKFTPTGGRVDVAVTLGTSGLRVIVRDTGEGIDAEVLPYVFERFRQADSSTTRPHGGLGLGLALVKHLTEIHGGRVEAASAGLGRGATFTVALPVSSSADRDSDAARSRSTDDPHAA